MDNGDVLYFKGMINHSFNNNSEQSFREKKFSNIKMRFMNIGQINIFFFKLSGSRKITYVKYHIVNRDDFRSFEMLDETFVRGYLHEKKFTEKKNKQ